MAAIATQVHQTAMGTPAFPGLLDRLPQKRGRTDDILNLFTRPKDIFPRFQVVHSERTEKLARTISPFVVAKTLTNTIGPGYKVTKMPSGDLLLELRDKEQHNRLGKLVTFGDVPVTVSPHRSMNTVRGVVSEADLIDLSETELLEGWKEQNVTNVQRIVMRRDNKEIPTKHLILTFELSELPQTIETGYTKIAVRPYIPNPRRCYQCQRFGHGSQSCRGRLTCAKCGVQGHASDNCEATPHCVNCDGEHPAYSRSCPSWKREKEMITLKVRENISFREARKRCSPFHTTTYADAALQGAVSQRPLPPAQPARSELSLVAPAPRVEVAKSTPPNQQTGPVTLGLPAPQQSSVAACASRSEPAGPPAAPTVGAVKVASPSAAPAGASNSRKAAPSTSELVGANASSFAGRLSRQTSRSQERVSGASQEAMDTTPIPTAHQAPKERRGSLDRFKKDKSRVTGPGKGSVI